jgi:uroporphyrinogen-III synthase
MDEESGNALNLSSMVISSPEARSGLPMLFLCGDTRRPELPQSLQAAGVLFAELVIYSTQQHEQLGLGPDAWERLHTMVFFSPNGARAVHDQLTSRVSLRSVRVCAIGPTTAEELRKLGIAVHAVAKRPTAEAVVDEIVAGK